MKPIAHGAIMFCVLSLNAIAQTESGTIVALNSSQNEIVVSADSRTELESRYFDNRCKITALGNKLIFAASGHTGYGTANSTTGGVINMQWDTHVIARKEFIRLAEKQTVHNFPLTNQIRSK